MDDMDKVVDKIFELKEKYGDAVDISVKFLDDLKLGLVVTDKRTGEVLLVWKG